MIRFQDISIKHKLRAIIMIASTIALLLVSGGFIAYEMLTYSQTMTTDLMTLAEVIGDRSTAAITFDNKADAEETLGALGKRGHIAAAAIYTTDGKLFAQYPRNWTIPGLIPTKPEAPGARFENDHLVIFQPIRIKRDVVGTIFLKSDLGEKHDRFTRYAAIVLLFLLTSLGITYALSSLLQRLISKPIFHLAETARAVSGERNYALRAHKHGNDEMGQLIDGFNEMLGQIQERDVALSRTNDELERRVAERTQDLREEIAGHQRTEASLQQQFARISLLNQITHSISDRQDTESILHVALRQLEDHMGLDVGVVALFDQQAKTLNVAALRVKNSSMATKFDLREGSVIALVETGLDQCEQGQTVYLSDTFKSPTLLGERLAGTGWRSAVAVPLMVEDKLFGILLTARLKPNDFSSGDSEFLRMLSEHVALSAHEDRLHKALEEAYNELRMTQATVMQQERLKALGQMASGIAHDVNNALSPVVGFADLLLRGEQGLTPNGKKYLKYIRTAGEDIAHIVARLREFYRRREDTEPQQELDLNSLAEQVVDMTRPRWRDIPQSNGITIEVQTDLTPDVPSLVGIESEVREAFTNLVINAVDAMPTGGKVTIRTRLMQRDLGQEGQIDRPTHVAVEISDTGVGMSAETQKRCLEPFFSTKGKRGTGLGLAMVYGVMERHEGTIEIDSELGKGTTFRLVFPMRSAKGMASKLEKGIIQAEPLQILCIDDEPLLRELIKEILERDGHAVEVTDGGKSGLAAFRSARERGNPFDVVITDLGMPYLDGKQVAKMLKDESPETPIVMLTGWGAFMKEEGDTSAQVDGILSKPPRSRELRETLCRFRPLKKSGNREMTPA